MKACKSCSRVFDVTSLPVVTTDVEGRRGIPSFKQEDIFCPACGALLARKIDGDEIGENYKDARAGNVPVAAPAAEKPSKAKAPKGK